MPEQSTSAQLWTALILLAAVGIVMLWAWFAAIRDGRQDDEQTAWGPLAEAPGDHVRKFLNPAGASGGTGSGVDSNDLPSVSVSHRAKRFTP